MSTDFANAFPTMARAAMLKGLVEAPNGIRDLSP